MYMTRGGARGPAYHLSNGGGHHCQDDDDYEHLPLPRQGGASMQGGGRYPMDLYGPASSPAPTPPGISIFVGGLTRSSTGDVLFDCLSHIGNITEVGPTLLWRHRRPHAGRRIARWQLAAARVAAL